MPAAPDGPSERAFAFMSTPQPSYPSPSDGPHVVLREDGIENNAGKVFAWNTTGSGKTLTSFKASTLLKLNDHIHRCVFVVNRKDLDRQTR